MRRFLQLILLTPLCLSLSCSPQLRVDPHSAASRPAPPVSTPAFAASMQSMAKAEWTHGNHIKTLENGDAFFPAMLAAIRSAKRSITFETYACVQSHISYDFCRALAERARAGVPVHTILDGQGSAKLGHICEDTLREAGVQLHYYRPMKWWKPIPHNNRDHRKLLIIDGEIGFTGGSGFASAWTGNAHTHDHWRDTQYALRGPVVKQLQQAFADNWRELTGDTLKGTRYYPPLTTCGSCQAQVTLGAPYEQGDTLGSSFLLAIKSTRHSILIAHSYFTPNKQLRRALKAAVARGVDVRVIVPGEHIDVPMLRTASKICWPELIDAGIQIAEFQPTMMHGKLIVVDDQLSIVGSGNFDQRSFFINDEANVHVLDRAFALEQRRMFERDWKRSTLATKSDAVPTIKELPARWTARLIMSQL